MILQPAYTRYHLELGEITSYPPGYKENAGIFCHNNPWISIAETVLGRGNRAFEVYRKICPSYIEEISDIHRTEPYVDVYKRQHHYRTVLQIIKKAVWIPDVFASGTDSFCCISI